MKKLSNLLLRNIEDNDDYPETEARAKLSFLVEEGLFLLKYWSNQIREADQITATIHR